MVINQLAVVTGATSGIGYSVSRRLAQLGYNVLLVGRNQERGYRLCKEIIKEGKKAEFIRCDISREEDVITMAEEIDQKNGRVDVLFNNAGIMTDSCEISKFPSNEWENTFKTNMHGSFYLVKHLEKQIVNCKGTIINNASIAGMHSYVIGSSYAYSASKAAIIQFTRQLALNYAKYGVRVNCICPGIIDTPILGERDREELGKRVPLGFIGTPEDVANVVSFLVSKEASYITGVVLPIDGGVSLT